MHSSSRLNNVDACGPCQIGYIDPMHDALSRFPLLVVHQSRQESSAKTGLLPYRARDEAEFLQNGLVSRPYLIVANNYIAPAYQLHVKPAPRIVITPKKEIFESQVDCGAS